MTSLTVTQFNCIPLKDIGKNIFDLLNNKDLKNCREVCKYWQDSINNEKYIWHRMIEVHDTKYSMWSEVWMNCNRETTRELALATRKYYFKFIHGENNLIVEDNENELLRFKPRSRLHFAIWLGNKDVFQCIWDKVEAIERTKPDEVDGMVPLQYAVEYGHFEVFQILYKNSEDKDPRGRNGYSLLHYAADKGNYEIVDEILKKDYVEDKNPKDWFGRSALHIAAREGHLTVCNILLEVTKNKNARDICGRLPLHVAAQAGHLFVFKLLFDATKDKNPKDDEGATPYSLALENGHHEVVGVIEKWQACRKRRGRGDICPPRPVIPGRAMASVKPISAKGGRLFPPNNTGTPGFLDLATALPPGFVQSIIPISNRGDTLSPPSITYPSGFSDLATALNGK